MKSKTYAAVGKDEVEIALAFTKEVLKAVYQLDQLTGQLRSLRKGEG